ncbi:MAG: FHA domain-containing protein [Kiritimatiellae bacterium]|nr:FHA domain-containing protein [Kiritimatiellia bacterium]
MLKLTVQLNKKNIGEFSLEEGVTIIGRSRTSDIKVDAPDISRSHLKITVSGGKPFVENMSKHGTLLNGSFIEQPVELVHGQHISIGDVTNLILKNDEALASDSPDDKDIDMKTLVSNGSSISAVEAISSAPATGQDVTMASEPAADDASHTSLVDVDTGFLTTGGGHTQAMQTRLVSPEELGLLKLTEQKRARKRIMMLAMVVVPVLILAVLFRPRSLPPEDVIEWPRDDTGDYVDAFEPAPGGGHEQGGFDVFYPMSNRKKTSAIPGGAVIKCWIGRDQDVPMRLFLQEEIDPRFLKMDRGAAVQDWMDKVSENGGRWNFDRPSPLLGFFGRENGVPYIRITYDRHDGESWYGTVSVFRNGSRRISIRAEVPSAHKVRAQELLAKGFIMMARFYQRSHWEPRAELPKVSSAILLRELRNDMVRMAPATWAETEVQLIGVLTKSAVAGDAEIEKEASDLLVKLRTRQTKWFNSQQFAWDNAYAQGDMKRAARVAARTKAVFSNIEDRRYYTVRRWRVDLDR